jgi:hypothetical protein
MQETRVRINRNMNRRGNTVLFIVFLLALGGLVLYLVNYFKNADSTFTPWKGSEYDRYIAPDVKPWEEDKLFWGGGALEGYDMSAKRPPFSYQPKVANRADYEINLIDEDTKMGKLTVSVLNNFDALAIWNGEFDFNGKHYKVDQWEDPFTKKSMNVFHGNIYPLKIYVDSKGKDRTKLYFITSGYFEMRGTGQKDILSGTAYVNGWMSKDFSAEGTLSIHSFDKDKDLIIKWGPVYPKENQAGVKRAE